MKKVIVLLALVAVGALVFAEDAPTPQYQFSANATGGWKYDINNAYSTFINDWDISLKYQLLNDLTKTKGAEEGTYGWIEVKHINIRILEEADGNAAPQGIGDGAIGWTDKSPDDGIGVTAKIVSGPIEVGLYGAPGTNYENAKYVPLFEKDAGYAAGTAANGASSDSAFKAALDSSKGLSLKYTIGDLGYIQAVAANTAYTAAAAAGAATSVQTVYIGTGTETAVAGTAYYAAADATLTTPLTPPLVAGTVYRKVVTTATAAVAKVTPKYLAGVNVQIKPVASDSLTVTIDGGFQMNFDSKDMIFTAKAAVAAGDLSVTGALDGGKLGASGSDLKFDAAANIAYALFEKKDSLNLDFYMANDKVGSYTATDLGLKFVDAEGLVPGLSFTLGAFWFDLLGKATPKFDPQAIAVAESVSYKYALSDSTYVKPYQALRYDLNDTVFGSDVMYLNIGVEAQFFPNTIFTVDYFKGEKNKDANENLVKNKDNSEFSIKAKVSL